MAAPVVTPRQKRILKLIASGAVRLDQYGAFTPALEKLGLVANDAKKRFWIITALGKTLLS